MLLVSTIALIDKFAQLVIFTEVGAGHFNNDVFHVFQVSGTDLKLFYETLKASNDSREYILHMPNNMKTIIQLTVNEPFLYF